MRYVYRRLLLSVAAATLALPFISSPAAIAADDVPTVTASVAAEVAFKGKATVKGKAKTAGGSALAGAIVELQRKVASSGWNTVKSATTSTSGSYKFAIKVYATTSFRAVVRAGVGYGKAVSTAVKTRLSTGSADQRAIYDIGVARCIKTAKERADNPDLTGPWGPDAVPVKDPAAVYRPGGPTKGIKVVRGYARSDEGGCLTSEKGYPNRDNRKSILQDSGWTVAWRKTAQGKWKELFGFQQLGCSLADGKDLPVELFPLCAEPSGVERPPR